MRISDSFDTMNERLEKFNSWQDHSPHFWSKRVELNPNNNVCIVKGTGDYKQWMYTHNLVTTAGDQYYGKKITLKEADGSAYGDSDFQTDGHAFHVSTLSGANPIRGCMILANGSVGTIAEGNTYTNLANPLDASTSGSLKNSTKILRTNYPRHNDEDSDNTGNPNDNLTQMVTWSYEWATGAFNTTGVNDLTGGVIVDAAGATTPATGAKLLTRFEFAASGFEKTASDTLKIFVNHTFAGAGA